jgi:hypothetical protein
MQSTLIIPMFDAIASALYLAFIGGIFLLIWLLYQQQQQQPVKRRSPRYKPQPIGNVPNDLRIKLLAMLGGHKPTAKRLLSLERKAAPGRPEEWYYSKVIEDLIRDRR